MGLVGFRSAILGLSAWLLLTCCGGSGPQRGILDISVVGLKSSFENREIDVEGVPIEPKPSPGATEKFGEAVGGELWAAYVRFCVPDRERFLSAPVKIRVRNNETDNVVTSTVERIGCQFSEDPERTFENNTVFLNPDETIDARFTENPVTSASCGGINATEPCTDAFNIWEE